MLYYLVDKFLMPDFCDQISSYVNKNKKQIVFDVGCFKGTFSIKLKKKIPNSKFYLFDPSPISQITNFNNNLLFPFSYFSTALGSSKKMINYNFNSYLPSSGSSISFIVKNDSIWQFSRKLFSLNFSGKMIKIKVKQDSLDNFVKKKKIPRIDILKIDTEGYEMQVLLGAKKILKKTKIIQIEVLDTKKKFKKKLEKTIKFLNLYGFKLVSKKRIWSVEILSNIKCEELLLIKNN